MAEIYMERKIVSGEVVERIKFRVGSNTKPRKGRVRGNTPARKQDANERDCVKRAARVLNCNYGHGDLLLSCNFDEESYAKIAGTEDEVREKAEHEADNFLLRMKRALKKQGIEPKTFTVVSDMDGDTGELVRDHIHIVITGKGFTMRDKVLYLGEKPLDKIWGRGHVDWEPLRKQADYTDLAAYLLRQVRRLPDARKYKASRNMAKPRVTEKLVYKASRIREPAGAQVMAQSEYIPGAPQYIRYIPRKKHEETE